MALTAAEKDAAKAAKEAEKAAAKAAKEAEKAAAKAAKEAEKAAAKDEKYSFDVGNPTELVPVQRPLVITPRSGSWANDEQAAFARTLNGYAYKNPEKWEKKKDALLAQLERLADHPEELLRVNGNPQAARVEFRNTAVTL